MANGSETAVPLIGILAVKNQLITKQELERALVQCAGSDDPEAALKAYFLSQELISAQNVQRLTRGAKALEIRKKEFKFGAIAVQKGFINQSVLKLALEEQENDIRNGQKPRLIGDMLVEGGMMTQRQRDWILKRQRRALKPVVTAEDVADQPSENQVKETEAPKKEKPPAMLPPEIIVGGIKLQMAGDYMAALLSKTSQFDEDVLVADIKDVLFDKGIVTGIVSDDMIDGFIRSSGFKTKAFRVAKGIRPVQGKDAKLEFFFNTDYLKAGGLDDKGNIDFKQRGDIPYVEAGTVLAEKTPAVAARNGQNLFGDEVLTQEGQDIPLRIGKGAKLSEDGLKVLADVRGYPKYTLSGVIYVHEEYVTEGDVDYETGHIEYDGNVVVKGCVKSGFKVRGNDISALELDGGILTADGNVTIRGGINEGKIYARGDVTAHYIHNSEIICMGNVQVTKEIVDSNIECSGSLITEHGKLISSTATAKMGVGARHIGTEMAAPCVVRVGIDAFTEKEVKKIQARMNAVKKKIESLEASHGQFKTENMELQRQITKLAHIQDRAQLEEKELQDRMASLENDPGKQDEVGEIRQQLVQLRANAENAEKNLDRSFEKCETVEESMNGIQQQIKALKAKLDESRLEKKNLIKLSKENPGNPMVSVAGSIQPGTTIKGRHCDLIVRKLIRHSKVREMLTGAGDPGGENRGQYEMKVQNF